MADDEDSFAVHEIEEEEIDLDEAERIATEGEDEEAGDEDEEMFGEDARFMIEDEEEAEFGNEEENEEGIDALLFSDRELDETSETSILEKVSVDTIEPKGGLTAPANSPKCSAADIKKVKAVIENAHRVRAVCARRSYILSVNAGARKICNNVKNRLRLAGKTIWNLQLANKKLRTTIRGLKRKLKLSQNKNKSLRHISKNLRRSNRNLISKNRSLLQTNKNLGEQVSGLHSTVNNLRQENKKLTLLVKRLNIVITKRNLTIVVLKKKLASTGSCNGLNVCAKCKEDLHCGSDMKCLYGRCRAIKAQGQSCHSACAKCAGAMKCTSKPHVGKTCCGGQVY